MHPKQRRWLRTMFILIFSVLLGAAASQAATSALNSPRGLAIDSKGNLYVANYGGNAVLVFNANYVLIRRITKGISAPTGVALDPYGNLWVANFGAGGSISEYSPSGVQNPGATITNGILAPESLAVDGLGDIWVENDYTYITMYDAYGNLKKTFNPQGISSPTGVATLGAQIAFGSATQVDSYFLTDFLMSDATGDIRPYINGFAIAFDSYDNFYASNYDGSVWYAGPYNYSPWIYLNYIAAGIAVDNVRGRIYFANQNGNQIQVYTTSASLVHTIE